ncbi:MAG: NADH-quinone oxidoreductase subunit L [Sulfuricurvum sp.]|uniref:NADH-quinone oxidoreductase subunit L n=1 Tax=Sulfuricurvum sp. TaxID=2025608 RepID=UPI002603BE4B|nr:NADH-quinone oxidoreductase subunit L [Sulfuricurvum sp.]MDD2828233.1 NADH-quinone oxidoreductase subunit L [Sulfuricurvum sp.]MDD4949812.1 NADH-quinone oxidoreductase subunit L [Sulfuricurvum sp.]
MEIYLYIALFAPLVGSLFSALFSASPKTLLTGVVASGLLFVSFVSSAILLGYVMSGHTVHVEMMTWIATGDLYIPFGFVVDQVSVTMMMVVSVVSTVVHVYSIGYMDHDKGFNRFFSWLSAFVFSMMVLVMSDNFLGLFIGWEGVGLCSWGLIGFWYHKETATWAANEAFIMNRIADLAMLIGIFMIYWNLGSLQYDVVFANIVNLPIHIVTWIGIFLFIGAMGKSAQFPLHTWLADAMEGPTPVSALIHAATMVTAGVYLVVRANPIYGLIPEVGMVIASLGAFVAMFAATMALVNRDMKRIIAYSTLSQLGYMFVAAGLGAYWVALFHLMAHAFFKALLFLGAGNVMHAMHDELDPFKMGGLKKPMKWTWILMTLASVALAGIYPLAGFFSKDLILEVAFVEQHYVLYTVLLLTAGLTAFYSFRLVALIFHGDERHLEHGIHPHEAYNFMLFAMAPLAVLAVIAGMVFKTPYYLMVSELLPAMTYHIHNHMTFWIMTIGTQLFVIGAITYAYKKYAKAVKVDKKVESGFFYQLLFNQYYIPKIYDEVFSKPYLRLSKIAWKQFDLKIVDATVDGIANLIYQTGENTHTMQNGNLSSMLRWMVIGLVVLLVLAVAFTAGYNAVTMRAM